MTVIDLANNIVDGGFFILKNQPIVPFEWAIDRAEQQQFVGTYRNSGMPIRDALIDMIRRANHSIFVVSFLLGDEELVDELITAANRLKGGVYVITALDERSLGRGLREYEDSEQGSPEERRKNFERLTSQGVYVRGHESCHAKYSVVDDSAALVGSANFVTKGFTWTGEADILLHDPAQVVQLRRLFTELWYAGCTWEVPPGETYLVAERDVQEPPFRPDAPSGRRGEVVWTNGPEQMSLLEAIRMTIDAAEDTLVLSTYSIVGMTENPHLIIRHVHDALNRGVKVRLFVRQRNAWPEQMAELAALHDAGVEIVGDVRNHAKVAIADAKQAVVFSANLDANHGLDSGVEVGVRIDESQCLSELIRYMDHVIANADTQFVRNPSLRQLDGRLAARWCRDWPFGSEVTVKCPTQDAERFATAVDSGPVLYEKNQDELILYADDLQLTMNTGQPEWNGRISRAQEPKTAGDHLQDWLQSVRRFDANSDIKRGFCTAKLLLEDLE